MPKARRLCSYLLGGCFAFSAYAEDNYLEEIVVTGTKRDTSLQDTPLAVTTLTEGALEKTFLVAFVGGNEWLANRVPPGLRE